MSSEETSAPRLAVMGGTFDPIHIGHLIAASEAMFRFRLDRVIFVPAGRPWQKSAYSDPEDRFMMATLAAQDHPSFAVSRIELDRRGPTYTADTMTVLRELYGGSSSLFFIAGADTVMNLGSWEHLDALRETTEMIAVSRPGSDLERIDPQPGWPRIHTMRIPGIDVSATDIRQRVRSGAPIDFLVSREVAAYIRSQGLYLGGVEREAAS